MKRMTYVLRIKRSSGERGEILLALGSYAYSG